MARTRQSPDTVNAWAAAQAGVATGHQVHLIGTPFCPKLTSPAKGKNMQKAEANFHEQVVFAAEAIERLAFEMPAPNAYTPRLAMIAIELKKMAKMDMANNRLVTG